MKQTGWGHVSDWYDKVVENDDSYQNQVILPNLLRMMEIKSLPAGGERILDLACGQGFFSRAFAEAGAEVVGVDIGEGLIKKAREKSPAIRFEIASADQLPFQEETFDKAVCVLALQNIENLSGTLESVASTLKPNACLYIVLNHPAFRIPGHSAWGFDEEEKVQYRRLDSYMSESSKEIAMNPGKIDSAVTFSFHRPLQVYFKALRKHGFAVTRLEEWMSHKASERGPRQVPEDRARKEFPLFLAIECKKYL